MHRLSKACAVGLLTGIVGLIVSLTPWGIDLEENVGLSVLFKMRGTRQAPADVVIVSIDRVSAEHLQLPSNPQRWPRALHARLTEALARAGAAVIVFDIIFDEARASVDDQAFAEAIRRANNVVLFAYLEVESLPVGGKHSVAIGGVHLEKLIPPMPLLASAARAYAPFPLPKVPIKVSRYWTFKTGANDLPTLPFVALHLFAREVYDEFLGLLTSVRPSLAAQLFPDQDAVLGAVRPSARVRTLRNFFAHDPLLAQSMLAQLSSAPAHMAQKLPLFKSLLKAYQSPPSPYLNFYGPPGTITTIPYHQILEHDGDDGVAQAGVDLRGKAVFVGLVENMRVGQKDEFYTVFSQKNGANISGVEIAASAFANLLEDLPIRPVGWSGHLAALLLWGLLLGLACVLCPTLLAAASAPGLGALYCMVVLEQFATAGSWYPLVVPLGVQLPLAFFGAVLWKYVEVHKERRNIRRAFAYYLPATVVAQLSKSVVQVEANNQVVYGTCLFTDVAHFTSLAETMEPGELGTFMNAYYAAVFEPVRRHGGIVSNLIGDGMLAIWPMLQPTAALQEQACLTALEIARTMQQVRVAADMAQLPTRIGLHAGNILLGNIGAHDHYQYTALGDIVNTASRIEGLNKYLGTRILVSETVMQHLDGFLARSLGAFLLVGKTQPLEIYELLCRQEASTHQQRSLCAVFAGALAAYRRQAWAEALAAFSEIVHSPYFKEDGPARFYIKQCEQYQAHAPGDEWNGVVRMASK